MTTQAEYSTDLVFKSRAQLCDLVPRLLEHSTLSFTAQDVLAFLGRKLHGKFEGEVLTDLRAQEIKGRLLGHRVKTPHETELDQDVRQGRSGPPD